MSLSKFRSFAGIKSEKELIPFTEVFEQVTLRHDKNLPDYVGQLKQVKVVELSDDSIAIECHGDNIKHLAKPMVLSKWAEQQFGQWLGVNFQKYYDHSWTTPKDVEDSINRHLTNRKAEFRIRSKRVDYEKAEGEIRAFLNPTYSPLDDIHIFEAIAKQPEDFATWYKAEVTDRHSAYFSVFDTLNIREGEPHFIGGLFTNSEVGSCATIMYNYLLRIICTNGLIAGIKNKLFYRKHTPFKDSTTFQKKLSESIKNYQETMPLLKSAYLNSVQIKYNSLDEATGALRRMGKAGNLTNKFLTEAETLLPNENITKFDLINALTQTARDLEPNKRFDTLRLIGHIVDSNVISQA